MDRYAIGNNPLDYGWIRWKRLNQSNDVRGIFNILIDNKLITTLKSPVDCLTRTGEAMDPHHASYCDDTRAFLVGGYFRRNDENGVYHGGNNNFRYFDDIYVDTTWSRVMLADNSNYESATIIQPQIPSDWTTNKISCTVNLGKFPEDGEVYLFVFDADNNHNPTGIPLQVGQTYDSEPSISNVVGGMGHGSTLTINGLNFGEKNPAPPLLWDDCTQQLPLSTYYDVYLPNNSFQGSFYNMTYRSLPFREVEGPNGNVRYILAGAHATDSPSGQYA